MQQSLVFASEWCIDECGELIIAIQRHLQDCNHSSLAEMVDEMVDVRSSIERLLIATDIPPTMIDTVARFKRHRREVLRIKDKPAEHAFIVNQIISSHRKDLK